MAAPRRPDPDDTIRITTAGSSPAVDLARRQRRYIISMSIRALCFVGAVVAGMAGLNWLWPILIVAALVLPYVAVVMANAGDSRDRSLPLPDAQPAHRRLGSRGA